MIQMIILLFSLLFKCILIKREIYIYMKTRAMKIMKRKDMMNKGIICVFSQGVTSGNAFLLDRKAPAT